MHHVEFAECDCVQSPDATTHTYKQSSRGVTAFNVRMPPHTHVNTHMFTYTHTHTHTYQVEFAGCDCVQSLDATTHTCKHTHIHILTHTHAPGGVCGV